MQNIYTNSLENSPKRALLKSMGITKEELERPIIGIICSQNDMVSGHSDIDKLILNIKEGIISKGGKPFVATTMSLCSGISMGSNGKYLLPSRELICDSIEALVYSAGYDAVVFVGSCDSTVPAMLMASARINLPCIFVSPGTSQNGLYNDKKTAFSTALEGVYAAKSGKISAFDLENLEESCCPSIGSGAELSTSNTLCLITEALGLALKNNGTYFMGSASRYKLAKKSGEVIMDALENQITPSKILNLCSLKNALRLIMSIGGSVDAIMHLTALAYELGINTEKSFNYDLVSKMTDTTPALARLAPVSLCYIQDFENAGGVYALLNELNKCNLIEDNITVLNKNILNLIEEEQITNYDTIACIEKPIKKSGGVTVLNGNLAEEGCLIRNIFTDEKIKNFTGSAKVFDSEEDAIFSLTSNEIKEGNVIVVRYEGPKGAPGMRELRQLASAVSGMGLENKVAIITDGRVGGTSKGIVVGHICPEAQDEGMIAFVEDGDIISIDIAKKKISVDIPAKILKTRTKKIRSRQRNLKGYLLRYSELVTSSKNGAVLKEKF